MPPLALRGAAAMTRSRWLVPAVSAPTTTPSLRHPARGHARTAGALDDAHAKLDNARLTQRRATDVLAALLQAGDPVTMAREHLENLNEDFFMTASAYMTLAQKEGNKDIVSRLERALSAAWTVKQSSLRPELQLLNQLVRAANDKERRDLYVTGGSELAGTLSTNDRWFFATLDRMTADVERQPPNPEKAALLTRLRAIKKETEALERQHAKQQK